MDVEWEDDGGDGRAESDRKMRISFGVFWFWTRNLGIGMYLLSDFLVLPVCASAYVCPLVTHSRGEASRSLRRGREAPLTPIERYHLLHELFPHFASLGMCDFEAFRMYLTLATCAHVQLPRLCLLLLGNGSEI